MTKTQKAEFILQSSEIRSWVLNHLKSRVESYGHWCPNDLFEVNPPTSFINMSSTNSKLVNDWLSGSKHLYNSDGAIALMKALLARLS